ncbi:hypothetical protein SDC9_48146 [bioreactor metagenome]|uniref:Uncharacterized protein n=1 Tax=bioreactor metagenome TaxID=1076179 RepID=A0A644WDJ4_9ZZZZ
MKVNITLQDVNKNDLIILSKEALNRGITIQDYINLIIKNEANNFKKDDEAEINKQLLKELNF